MEEKNDTMKFFGALKNSKTISYIEKEVEKFRKISRVIWCILYLITEISLANGIAAIITKDKDFLKIEKISPLKVKLIK